MGKTSNAQYLACLALNLDLDPTTVAPLYQLDAARQKQPRVVTVYALIDNRSGRACFTAAGAGPQQACSAASGPGAGLYGRTAKLAPRADGYIVYDASALAPAAAVAGLDSLAVMALARRTLAALAAAAQAAAEEDGDDTDQRKLELDFVTSQPWIGLFVRVPVPAAAPEAA